MRIKTALPFFLFCLLALGACASTSSQPSVRLALDGPPLAIVAKGEGQLMRGEMDRSCMAGTGSIRLVSDSDAVECLGTMDRPATDKGRLYIELACDNGRAITLGMRNLGPDQGMGLGQFQDNAQRLLLFYHPWEEEAFRRLALLEKDMIEADKLQAEKATAEKQ